MKPYLYVYVLRLANGSYYTGFARDPLERLARHAAGRGSRLARSFRPLQLAGCWRVRGGRSEAQRVEAFLKSRPRAVKELLLREPSLLAASLRRATGSRLRPLPCLAALGRGPLPGAVPGALGQGPCRAAIDRRREVNVE